MSGFAIQDVCHLHGPFFSSRLLRRSSCRSSLKVFAEAKLPRRGYFADVDPTAPIYPPLAGQNQADIYKRGGRYSSDFIWNIEWEKQLDYEEQEKKKREEAKKKEVEPESGFLSVNRVQMLNRMDVDLTEELLRPRPKVVKQPVKPKAETQKKVAAWDYVVPPSKSDLRRWQREDRFLNRSPATPVSTTAEGKKVNSDRLAAELARYNKLKGELQLWTVALAGSCTAIVYVTYSQDVSVSFLFGSIASLLYLRMLNQSIDGSGGALGAVLAQPRLLVPVVLVMVFNRWNFLAAEQTGITLQLLPMLLGFFTYKGAVVARTALTLLSELASPGDSNPIVYDVDSAEEAEVGESGVREMSARELDREFSNSILSR